MPLIAWSAVAYAVGLLIALSSPTGGAVAAATLATGCCVVALGGRRPVTAAVAAILAGGILTGLASAGTSPGTSASPLAARPTSALPGVQTAAGARIDRLFGSDAPIVRALVIADMSAVPPQQRDRFARSGLVHMLSVSGLHVAIIALALELLASALRVPPTAGRVGTLLLLAVYVAGIGAPAPAVRAAVMLGVLMVSRIAQRPTSPWAVLAVGGVAPLVDARTVLDLGWQLSVAGTVALVAGGSLATRALPSGWRGHPRAIARGLIVSVVATAVTAPLVAWSFGRLALLGPFTNLVADPVMALLQPVLFLGLCIPIPVVEHLAADAAHVLIAAFDGIAAHAAVVPGAAPVVLPSTSAAWLGGGAALAVVVACVSRRPARPVLAALACASLMVVEPLVRPAPGVAEVHMLDVGQGDAIALRTGGGRWILVDAGRIWSTGDAGRSVVVPYVAHRGGAVALFVLSHPHADHVGGAASVFAALHPGRFLDPGYVGSTASYLAALEEARVDAIPWQRVRPGDSLVVDDIVLTALAPDSAWAAHLDDANLASTVLLARVGDVRILLTGDAEAPEEEWLLAHAPEALRADVLKVAHHGSATSTTPAFLTAVRPRIALVSVGANNTYGHPDAAVMEELAASGAAVLRTDRLGTVIVRTDGRSLEIEARGMRWTVPRRSR
jgi:competence protein ComEC